MTEKLDGLKLPTKQFNDLTVYLLNIPCPPQLLRAIGYQDSAEYVGVWLDNSKVSVNDGHSNFTSSNPAWESYLDYPLIHDYLYDLCSLGTAEIDLFGTIESLGVAEHGFLLAEGQIYLATVKTITQILSFNSDDRPSWIKDATEKDLFDEDWQNRYQAYSSSRSFPKYNVDCLQATQQMLCWLEGNF